LQRCYEIAPPRVRQYLAAELHHVLSKIHPGDIVLELGCGYGRVFGPLAAEAGWLIGVDTAKSSLNLGRALLRDMPNCILVGSDAAQLAFADRSFDMVVCIQNGISAFHVDRRVLIRESLRVLRPAGLALFSSYAEKFWPDRLEWFQLQADHGLLGEIDHAKTGDGVIICKDGFTATTVNPDAFRVLAEELGVEAVIEEIDSSSVFCQFRK